MCQKIEEYVSMDYVGLKELIMDAQEIDKYKFDPIETINEVYITKTEKEILTLLGKGLSRADVCEVLGMSRNTFRWHYHNLKKKHEES